MENLSDEPYQQQQNDNNSELTLAGKPLKKSHHEWPWISLLWTTIGLTKTGPARLVARTLQERINKYRTGPANLITLNKHSNWFAACGVMRIFVHVSSHKVQDETIKIFATAKAAIYSQRQQIARTCKSANINKLVTRLFL